VVLAFFLTLSHQPQRQGRLFANADSFGRGKGREKKTNKKEN